MLKEPDTLLSYPGLANVELIGTPGFSRPIYNDMLKILCSGDDKYLMAKSLGLTVNNRGQGNVIVLDRAQTALNMEINFFGNDNVVCIGKGHGASGIITFNSSFSLCCIGGFGLQGQNTLRVTMGSDRTVCYLGNSFTSVGAHILVQGVGRTAIFGDDCMLSWEVFIRNYDSHAIIDLVEKCVTNHPRDLLVGPHVWIGQRAYISKGVRIGGGSVIGAGSIVVKNIPEYSAAAGNPAKVIRTNITWSRNQFLPEQQISSVLNEIISTVGVPILLPSTDIPDF